ncbi:hypothetical protein CERZMDRAFT_100647 [Cercospora zeae-maydis SCOH1-5]|uniref:Uncharacterized protein n=1 Tax=Cercospora zeae-maydis SCOH1-5 TaxID=717836 RepID=A0A6A6F7C5_9PEZI|nr:hypothetical protein CERZMDRAFT_100647 [Cercospora zeae-maydis SCOH1-5]
MATSSSLTAPLQSLVGIYTNATEVATRPTRQQMPSRSASDWEALRRCIPSNTGPGQSNQDLNALQPKADPTRSSERGSSSVGDLTAEDLIDQDIQSTISRAVDTLGKCKTPSQRKRKRPSYEAFFVSAKPSARTKLIQAAKSIHNAIEDWGPAVSYIHTLSSVDDIFKDSKPPLNYALEVYECLSRKSESLLRLGSILVAHVIELRYTPDAWTHRASLVQVAEDTGKSVDYISRAERAGRCLTDHVMARLGSGSIFLLGSTDPRWGIDLTKTHIAMLQEYCTQIPGFSAKAGELDATLRKVLQKMCNRCGGIPGHSKLGRQLAMVGVDTPNVSGISSNIHGSSGLMERPQVEGVRDGFPSIPGNLLASEAHRPVQFRPLCPEPTNNTPTFDITGHMLSDSEIEEMERWYNMPGQEVEGFPTLFA